MFTMVYTMIKKTKTMSYSLTDWITHTNIHLFGSLSFTGLKPVT